MRSCSLESQYPCWHYLSIIGAHPLFATQHTKPDTAYGSCRQRAPHSKARVANVGNPASSQMPAVPGYSRCHRGLIQISPYNAWFIRVQHRADHGPPLRQPGLHGSSDGNPSAHVWVHPMETWHTIRRGRAGSARRNNPDNHADMHGAQPPPRCAKQRR